MAKNNNDDPIENRIGMDLDEIAEIEAQTPEIPTTRRVSPPEVSEADSNTLSTPGESVSTASNTDPEHPHVLNDEELKPQPTAFKTNDYFEDDEEFLRGDDTQIHSDSDLALFKQEDGVVSWKILNFYKDNGTPRSKLSLRNDPPIMQVSDSAGRSVDFILTQNFTKSMSKALEDVNRGFHGVRPVSEKKPFSRESFQKKIEDWIRAHKVKSALAALAFGFIVLVAFLL